MKGRYFKWIAILAAACVLGMVLLGATADREVYQVRQLLEKRSNIMEKTLFGEITYDEGKRQLKEVEADKLYRDDVEALIQFEDTDLERTRAMDRAGKEEPCLRQDVLLWQDKMDDFRDGRCV